MKKIVTTLGLLAGLSFGGSAFSKSCHFTYHIKGGGVQFFVGYFKLTGTGKITCSDGQVIDTAVTLGGRPVATRIAFGGMKMVGASADIIVDDASNVFGDYLIANSQVVAGVGVGGQFLIENPHDGHHVSVGVSAAAGLSVLQGVSIMSVEPLPEKKHKQRQRHDHHQHQQQGQHQHDVDQADDEADL